MTQQRKIYAEWDVSQKVVAFTTTREGGVSSAPYASFNLGMHVGDDPGLVQQNRAALHAELPPDLEWQQLNQVHGIVATTINRAGSDLDADALITTRSNLACCVQTADCLPIFVAAIDGAEVAVIHAGWRGLAAGIVENTVAAMSTPATRLAVWLGPAIGACHFEVGSEVVESFLRSNPYPAKRAALEECFVSSAKEGKYLASLPSIARLKLVELGVTKVTGGDRCTYCEEGQFYSYRRDGVTGRMFNAIYIEA